jgi:hypothetical protein
MKFSAEYTLNRNVIQIFTFESEGKEIKMTHFCIKKLLMTAM